MPTLEDTKAAINEAVNDAHQQKLASVFSQCLVERTTQMYKELRTLNAYIQQPNLTQFTLKNIKK